MQWEQKMNFPLNLFFLFVAQRVLKKVRKVRRILTSNFSNIASLPKAQTKRTFLKAERRTGTQVRSNTSLNYEEKTSLRNGEFPTTFFLKTALRAC